MAGLSGEYPQSYVVGASSLFSPSETQHLLFANTLGDYLLKKINYYLILCLISLMKNLVSEKQTDSCCPDQNRGDIILLDWVSSH